MIINTIQYKDNFITIVIQEGNKHWFCGKEVACILGYKDVKKALQELVGNKYKVHLHHLTGSSNYHKGKAIYINQEGLSCFLVRSKLPNKCDFIRFCEDRFGIRCKTITILQKEQEYIGYIITVFNHEDPCRQFSIGGYRIDLYFPIKKLAIECDEYGHKDRNHEYEATRETFIKDRLGCTFIRFNPDSKEFCIFKTVGKICQHLYLSKAYPTN